jgi:hypothetical protein
MTELQEKIESFQNLLIDIATSGNRQEEEENFRQLRTALIGNNEIKNHLPDFVKTTRTAAQFWQFIKGKFSTYAERRVFIWNEFEAVLNYVETKQNGTTDNVESKSKNKNMSKLFISHSSKDGDKINPLIDLIENIGVAHNQIFYSSHPAYGVDLGQNIFDRLKTELEDKVFALFILSDNFYKSPVCLCEMGAVWIKSNKQIPILIPPFGFKEVQGVFSNSLGFKINDKDQLNSFKGELETYFNLTPIHLSRWEEKRDAYLSKINDLLNKKFPATSIDN